MNLEEVINNRKVKLEGVTNLLAKLAAMDFTCRAYPSDERGFLLPYLLLVREDAEQRQ